ncbi:SRPBCC family protein [Achromobacter denitrificans]|uniref:SRPBCC domain-containing protein n=1 Tax=Achromobacter denitrificans TaxID=32002 RepID=A0ABZ3FV66_ACHDE|nr:polyketide cyclase [Achromobacter sp.]QCS64239.1 polyketide cyclase [Achromobacter denitrificans]
MTDSALDDPRQDILLEYELDAPPEKVWRALSIPEFREQWLPGLDLASPDPVDATPQEEVRYRMRDDEPPFLESVVTFQLRPAADGRSLLRIIHVLADERLERRGCDAANDAGPFLMRAA